MNFSDFWLDLDVQNGVMATHDEETRKFFKHSSVSCVLSPRYASSKLSIFKQQACLFFIYCGSVLIAFFIWLFLTKSHSLLWQFILLYETGYKLFMVKFGLALVFQFCNVLIIENIVLLILKIDGHFKILIVFKRGKTSLLM